MAKINTISGTLAIQRMREMRHSGDGFEMQHITWNKKKRASDGLRVVRRAKVRPALPSEKFFPHADLFLPYIDIDLDEPRTCYKHLIRMVAFPPNYEPLKVNWHE